MMEQNELMRRLKLVRDIRLNYINKYNVDKKEILFNYSLLPNLDRAEYVTYDDKNGRITWNKTVYTKTITHYDPYKDARYNTGEQQVYWGDSEVIHGDFIEELGYIYYKELVDENFSDEFIYQKEKKCFDDLISFIVYSLNETIKYTKEKIKKETNKSAKLEEKLKHYSEIRL